MGKLFNPLLMRSESYLSVLAASCILAAGSYCVKMQLVRDTRSKDWFAPFGVVIWMGIAIMNLIEINMIH
jgi:hypothetical protein